jgi:hypothetical protein
MKKIMKLFVYVAAAAMTLASCQKTEVDNNLPKGYEYTFLLGSADTKAVVGDNCVEWEAGDRVGSFTKVNNGYSEVSVNDGQATISVYSPEGLAVNDKLYFYYPKASGSTVQKTSVPMSILTEQDGKDEMPMVSLPFVVKTESNKPQTPYVGEIKFANLGAVIEFKVYTETPEYEAEVVKSVTFEADQSVAGNFSFDLTKVDYSNASTTLVIPSESLTEKNIVANVDNKTVGTRDNPVVVRMVVAPGSYTGKFVVKTDVASYTFPISEVRTFERSSVKPFGLKLRPEVREVDPTKTVTFDFAKNEWNLPVSATGSEDEGNITGEIKSGEIAMTVTKHGSTSTRLWRGTSGSVDLRAYNGSSLSFTAPEGHVITKMIFSGAKVTTGFNPQTGTYAESTWVGAANPVNVDITATVNVNTIVVEYVEGEVEVTPLTMEPVTCVNKTATSLTFSWDAVTGAEGYKVSLDGGNTWGDQFNATNYTWEDLDPETDYTIYVKAIGNGINTSDSEAVFCTGTTDVEQEGVEEVECVIDLTQQGYSNQQEVSSVSKNPITIAFNQGSNSNVPKYFTTGTAVRVYGGGYFTVSSDKTIVKIVLTFGNDDGNNAITTDCGSYNTNTWTGNSNSVKFSIGGTSGNRRIQKITVTYQKAVGEVILASRDLKFSLSEATATVGQPFTAPTLDGEKSGVTYTSSNPNAATVNESTGEVTLVAAGTTTITASAPKTDQYEADTASYTLTVSAAQPEPDQPGGEDKVPSTTACYTLDGTNKCGNNQYDKESNFSQNGIEWGVVGNTDISPWRIGGKSLTNVDRNVYTKTAWASELSKIEFISGTLNVTSWNSLTLVYSTNSDFSNSQTMVVSSVGANKTIEFLPEGGFPANCYYKFILNITVNGGSNKYVQLKEIKFYGYEN